MPNRLTQFIGFVWILACLLQLPTRAQTSTDYTPPFAVYQTSVSGWIGIPVPSGYSLSGAPMLSLSPTPTSLNSITNLYIAFPTNVYPFAVTKLRSDGKLGSAYFTPQVGWTETNMTLLPGEGAVLWNPGPGFTNHILGSVLAGFLTNELPAGLTLCSSSVPLEGLLTSDLQFPASAGDAVFFMNADGSYRRYEYSATGWLPEEPFVRVAEAFWSHKSVATNWVRYFSVFDIPFTFPGYFVRSFAAEPAISTNTLHRAIPYLPMLPGRIFAASSRTVELRTTPLNPTPATYQWQKNGVALTDGLRLTGTQGDTLLLSNLQLGVDDGTYTVAATNAAGRVVAHVARLQVVTAATVPPTFERTMKNTNLVEHTLQVQPGTFYRVHASTDLQLWTEATNFISTGSTHQLSLTVPTNGTRLFYRLVSP